jgi:hypothetical protein
MKITFRHFVQSCAFRCKTWLKRPAPDAARAQGLELLPDNTANVWTSTRAFDRWHMLAASLIFG